MIKSRLLSYSSKKSSSFILLSCRLAFGFILLNIINGCAVIEGLNAAKDLGGGHGSFSPAPQTRTTQRGFLSASGIGGNPTDRAIVSFFKGDLEDAEFQVREALTRDPNDPYALLVGGVVYEQIGRPNRARQHYEDILIMGFAEPSILSGFTIQMPKPIAETARERMKLLEVTQGGFVLKDPESGTPHFNTMNQPNMQGNMGFIPQNAPTFFGTQQGVFPPNQQSMPFNPYQQQQFQQNPQPQQFQQQHSSGADYSRTLSSTLTDLNQPLFTEPDRNVITRFATFKKLAEDGLITREEFYARRQANVGGLLPQTNGPPANGIHRSVPSPDMIIDRLRSLREAFERRSITAREHASERSLILDALLPANPTARAETPPPPKDMLEGAEALRRLEVLLKMGLITDGELSKEKQTIERIIKLGISEVRPVAPSSPPPTQKSKLDVPGLIKPVVPLNQK